MHKNASSSTTGGAVGAIGATGGARYGAANADVDATAVCLGSAAVDAEDDDVDGARKSEARGMPLTFCAMPVYRRSLSWTRLTSARCADSRSGEGGRDAVSHAYLRIKVTGK